jgi:DNA-directed RNA polymerase subunit RPC12/RpoP
MAVSKHPDEYITVVCPTCHARVSARWDQAGKRLACPDCGVRIDVPFPQPPAPNSHAQTKPVGEYRVSETGRPARHPDDVITVVCATCHARLVARWDQAGKTKSCPDCGVKIRVPFPKARPPEPKLDPARFGQYNIGAAEKTLPVETHFLDQQAVIYAVPVPPPPRWTFFSGVFQFPWHRDTLPRWLVLSIGLLTWSEFVVGALALSGVGGEGIGGLAVVAIGFMVLPIAWLSIWTGSYVASCLLAIVQDTAAGNDLISWPDETWRDRFWKLLYVSYLIVIASLVGAGVGWLVEWRSGWFWPPLVITAFVLFPIMLLSTLERDSIWFVLSPAILKSLFVVMWGWLMFYSFAVVLSVSAALPVGVGFYFRHPFIAALFAAPLASAMILIYARLLGRLAWKITERLEPPSPPLRHPER